MKSFTEPQTSTSPSITQTLTLSFLTRQISTNENITKFICISAKKYIQVTPTETKVVGLHKLKNKPENVEEYFEHLYASIL